MTSYNDGNWHGWIGGECPVHPDSLVEVIHIAKGEPSRIQEHEAASQIWENVVAFRVVKERKEPREFWIYEGEEGDCILDFPANGFIHVREVTE